MATTAYDEVFDTAGNLIARTERVVPDPEPSPEERIAALEARLTGLTETMEAVGDAANFADAKAAIKGSSESELPVDMTLPEKRL